MRYHEAAMLDDADLIAYLLAQQMLAARTRQQPQPQPIDWAARADHCSRTAISLGL